MDMDEAGLTRSSAASRNLRRANNIQARHAARGRKAAGQDHWKKRFPELEKELLDTYYKFKGWNTKRHAHQGMSGGAGLDFVYEDLPSAASMMKRPRRR